PGPRPGTAPRSPTRRCPRTDRGSTRRRCGRTPAPRTTTPSPGPPSVVQRHPSVLRATDRRRCRRSHEDLRGVPGPSALEQELDRVAQHVLDLLAQLGVLGERGVVVEDLLGNGTRFEDDRLVARDPPELQVAEPGLTLSEDLPRAADLEVALGEEEPVRGR